jgi:hypothetical protein
MIPCSCVPDLIFPRVFWPRVRFGLLFFWHGSVIIWPGQSRHICFSCPPRFRPAAPCCPVWFSLRPVVQRFFSRSSLRVLGRLRSRVLLSFCSAVIDFIFVRQSWFFRRVLAKTGFFSLGLCAKPGFSSLRLSSRTGPIFWFAQGAWVLAESGSWILFDLWLPPLLHSAADLAFVCGFLTRL